MTVMLFYDAFAKIKEKMKRKRVNFPAGYPVLAVCRAADRILPVLLQLRSLAFHAFLAFGAGAVL
jgi:hypothetical protein